MKNVTPMLLAGALTAFAGTPGTAGPADAATGAPPLLAQASPAPPALAPSGHAARELIREEGRKFLLENGRREGVVSLPSGVQYEVLAKGEGASPGPSDAVLARYDGTLTDGTSFGKSKGETPERLEVAKLVPGLAEAVRLMNRGARWKIFIPPDLSFRGRGPLEDRVIVYDFTLVGIEASAAR